jgi:hypothetical protein
MLRKLVGDQLFHQVCSQDPLAIERPAVQQHLGETVEGQDSHLDYSIRADDLRLEWKDFSRTRDTHRNYIIYTHSIYR